MDSSIPSATPSSIIKKRSKVSRACDECRRKKIKCDAVFNNTTNQLLKSCSHCSKISETCSFERQPLKRGPTKGFVKNNNHSNNNNLSLPLFSNSSISNNSPSSTSTTRGISKLSASPSISSNSSQNSSIHNSNSNYFTRHLSTSASNDQLYHPSKAKTSLNPPSYTIQSISQPQPSHVKLPPINTITSPQSSNPSHSILNGPSDSTISLDHHHQQNYVNAAKRVSSRGNSPVSFTNHNNSGNISSTSPLLSPKNGNNLSNNSNNNSTFFNFSNGDSNGLSKSPSTSSSSPSPFLSSSVITAGQSSNTGGIKTQGIPILSQQRSTINNNQGTTSSFLSNILNSNNSSTSSTRSFVPSFNTHVNKADANNMGSPINTNANSNNNTFNNNTVNKNMNNNNNSNININNNHNNNMFWKATNVSSAPSRSKSPTFGYVKDNYSTSLQSDSQNQLPKNSAGDPYLSSRRDSIDSVNSFASTTDFLNKPTNFPIISGPPNSIDMSSSSFEAPSTNNPISISALHAQYQNVTSNVLQPTNGGTRSFNEQLDDNLLFYYKTIHPNLPIMPLQRFQFDLLVNEIPNTPENRLVLNLFSRALHILVCVVAKENLNSIFAPSSIPTNIIESETPYDFSKESSKNKSKGNNANGNDSSAKNHNGRNIKKLMLIKDILHPLFIQFFQLYPNWTQNSDNDHLNLLLLMAINLMNYIVVNSGEDVSIPFSCTITMLSHLRLEVRVKEFIERYQRNAKAEAKRNSKDQGQSTFSLQKAADIGDNKNFSNDNSKSNSSPFNSKNMDTSSNSKVDEISLMYTRSLMISVILDSIYAVSFGTAPVLQYIKFDHRIVDSYLFSSLFLTASTQLNSPSPQVQSDQPMNSSIGSGSSSTSNKVPGLQNAINNFKFGLLFSSEIYPLLVHNDTIISFDNFSMKNDSFYGGSASSMNNGTSNGNSEQTVCTAIYKLKEFINEARTSNEQTNDSQTQDDDFSTCLAQVLADHCEFMLAISHLKTAFSQENITSLSLISLKKNITDYQLKLLLRVQFETLPIIVATLKSIVTNTASMTTQENKNTGKSLSFVSSSSSVADKKIIIQSPWIPVFYKYIIRYLNIIQIVLESSKFNYESMKHTEPEVQHYLQNINSTILFIFQEYLPLIQPFNDANDYGISNFDKINNNFKRDITNTLASSSTVSNNPPFLDNGPTMLTSSNLYINTNLAAGSVSQSSSSLASSSAPSVIPPAQSYPMVPKSPSMASSYSAAFSSSNVDNEDTVMSQEPQIVRLSYPTRVSSNQQTFSSASANNTDSEVRSSNYSMFLNSRSLFYFLTLQRSSEFNGIITYSLKPNFSSSNSNQHSYYPSTENSPVWSPNANSPSSSCSNFGESYNSEKPGSSININNTSYGSDNNSDVDIIRNFSMWKSLLFDIEDYLNNRHSKGWIYY